MEQLKLILTLMFGLPIGLTMTAVICIFASLLWLIFIPWKAFDYVLKCESEALKTFEEFIFVCYALGGACTILVLAVIGDDTID